MKRKDNSCYAMPAEVVCKSNNFDIRFWFFLQSDERCYQSMVYNISMNIFKKITYFLLSIREKSLKLRLDKHLKSSSSNRTSKTVVSSNMTLTLNSETEKNKELVKRNIEELLKSYDNDPNKLLTYIKSQGTAVCKLTNADKVLWVINEEEGFITELRGFDALYLNFMTKSKLSFKSEPLFVMREGEIDPFYMIHQFYKWYSLKHNLPGFDYVSQKHFKKYMNSKDTKGMENLSLDEMTGLQEAIARDREATDFAYNAAKAKEGGKQVFNKMSGGGADI